MLSLRIFFNSRKKVQVNIMLCVVVVDDQIIFKNNPSPKDNQLIGSSIIETRVVSNSKAQDSLHRVMKI